ncbi:MAG: DegT/DnrJ/EryC1/StrS family aminotransferase, partial [bacterium]|nr:DegT/DnrJ/EryC1/StrS family aminotransferase [bacterium]
QGMGGKVSTGFWGTQYDMAIFSFGMGKNLMASAGGILVSNILEKEILEESKNLSNEDTKIVEKRFKNIVERYFSKKAVDLEGAGIMSSYKYNKMHPLDARLLSIQLDRLEVVLQRRRRNAEKIIKALKKTSLKFNLQNDTGHTYTKLSLIFENTEECSKLKSIFLMLGVEPEDMYTPLHLRDFGTGFCKCSLPYSEKVYRNVFNIPVRPNLTKKELNKIIKVIEGIQ